MQTEEPSSTQFPRVRAARWAVGIAFGLGLAFELLFDGHVPGISIPLWVGLCVAGLLLAARFERAHLSLQGRHLAGGRDRPWLWSSPSGSSRSRSDWPWCWV